MKQHILLIEDNDEIRENTAEILILADYKVTTAANGKLGVEAALANRPDLIICDVMMPVLDGYGVLHLVNKNHELAGIPFIFLTAKSERADLRKGMEMGADDYITKPFTDIELLSAIESRLKKVASLRNAYTSDENGIKHFLRDFKGEHALQNFLANRVENLYKKKQNIYHTGNHPQKLFFVKEGKVKTFITSDDGKGLTIGLFTSGDFFGYTALLENSTYRETAETLDDSVIVEIPVDDFRDLINSNTEATHHFIKLMTKNIAEKETQLLNVAYNSLRKRVANALIILRDKYTKAEEKPPFSIHLSREDLANIAGTATESLIRTLSDFKSENLIKVEGSKITLLNEQKLKNMLN
ncbi:MAG: response regulator [Ferruginibacter sp.]|mgnify:CR=1 FL=1|nr:response regulator [Ferruginibacter sp.]